ETDELADLRLGVGLIDIQPAAVVGDLAERAFRREVKDVALALEDLLAVRRAAVGIADRPRRLDPKRGLEIGLRARQVPEHEDAAPRLDGHSCGQLAARKRNRLRLER